MPAISRRTALRTMGAAAVASSTAASIPIESASGAARDAAQAPKPASSSFRMPGESADTPKICLGFYGPVDEASMRRVKQIGVDYVLTGGPRMPWDEAAVRARIDQFAAGGLRLYNMMISGFNDVIWGRPGADAQIEQVIASIRAAGKAGLPVIEYNFYAHRLTEGYKEEIGRAGAGLTAYDYSLSKDLPPRDDVGPTRAPIS
jgi:mannonate dehydratase